MLNFKICKSANPKILIIFGFTLLLVREEGSRLKELKIQRQEKKPPYRAVFLWGKIKDVFKMSGCELENGIGHAVNKVIIAKTQKLGSKAHHEAMQELVQRIAAERRVMTAIGRLKETQM